MTEGLHVVHYINQFFVGIGGEEVNDMPVEVKEGAVGPGRALNRSSGTWGLSSRLWSPGTTTSWKKRRSP